MVWSTVGFVGTRALSFVSVLILARLLVPSQFGAVAAVVVFLAFIELGSDLGMRATVVYEQEQGVTRRVQTAFTTNLIVAASLTVIGVLIAPAVAAFFDLEAQTYLFRLAALNLLVTGLGNIHDSLLLRDLEFGRRIIPEIIRALVRSTAGIALALAGLGAAALVYGFLAGTAAWTATQWYMTRFRPTFTLDRKILRSMAGYGSGAAVLEVIAVITTRADVAVIGRVLGERALGLYTIAFRVPELLIESVASNLSLVAFPAFARERLLDEEGLGAATLAVFRYQALYAIPVAVGLAVLGPPLIVVLFSSTWTDAGPVVPGIAVMAGMSATVFPLGDVFKAVGRQRTLALFHAVQLPLLIGLIVAASSLGIVAVAWARAVMMAGFASVLAIFVFRLLSVRPSAVWHALRPALAAGVGAGAGAGAARLAMPDLAIVPLLGGSLAGVLGALVMVLVFAPGTIDEICRRVGWSPRSPDRTHDPVG